MHKEKWRKAYESLGPDQAQRERIWARLMAEGEAVSPDQEIVVKPKAGKRRFWRTAMLAAAITALMGASAYALGVFGREALELREPETTPYKLVIGEDGKGRQEENPEEGGFFSITQPQELPEELDPAVREKVENSRTAWAEWTAWKEANDIQIPASFEPPENSMRSELREEADGSWTLVFSRPDKSDEELAAWTNRIEDALNEDREKGLALQAEYDAYFGDPANWVVLEERSVTAAEVEQNRLALEQSGRTLEGYDANYRIRNEEQAAKLEEIAGKYGLSLRKDRQTLFGRVSDFYTLHGKPDWMSEEVYQQQLQNTQGETAEEMLAALSGQCCRGELFAAPPAFVDHLYWYQEGSFGVNFTWVTKDGKLANCYLYNSMYATLSSGWELFDEIEDVSSYTARTYRAQDGTELVILESDHQNVWGWHADSYLYVYLEDSFLVIKVSREEGLSPAELEEIADGLNYRQINK
jgi:hypothetical protein